MFRTEPHVIFKTKKTINAPTGPITKFGDQSRIIATDTSRDSRLVTERVTNVSNLTPPFQRDCAGEATQVPRQSTSMSRHQPTRITRATLIFRSRRVVHFRSHATRSWLWSC